MRLIKVFKYKLALLIFIIISCFTGCKTTEDITPHAKQDIMELSQWNFNKSGNVKLDGEWEFYWNQILSPEDLFLISALIIISLIQCIKFFALKERGKFNYMTLILSINCILYAIVTSGLREKVLYQMFPLISTEFLYRIVEVSIIAYFILDLILIMKLSNKFMYTFFIKMSLAFFSFQVFLILFTPMYTYTLFQDEFFVVNTLIILLFTIYLVVAIYKKSMIY